MEACKKMSTAGAILGIVLVTLFISDLEEVNGLCYSQNCRLYQSVCVCVWGEYELLTHLRAKLSLYTVCILGGFKDWILSSHEKSGLISCSCFEQEACLETSWSPFYLNYFVMLWSNVSIIPYVLAKNIWSLLPCFYLGLKYFPSYMQKAVSLEVSHSWHSAEKLSFWTA